MEEENMNKQKIPTWVLVAGVLITIILLLAIVYLTFIRYKLVGFSIEKGDSTTSALLLSPEIAAGLARIL